MVLVLGIWLFGAFQGYTCMVDFVLIWLVKVLCVTLK